VSTSPQNRAIAALLGAAFLFGATFVVVKSALADMEPIAFVAWRFLIGGLVLLTLGIPRGRAIWRHGLLAGLALFAGYALQTAGLEFTSASSSALITGLYIVLTPFLAAIVGRRLPGPWVIVAAAGAFVGVALLTGIDGLSLDTGDLLTLGCALGFALHIVILSRYARLHPVIPFTTVQILVTMALAFPASAMFESGLALPDRSTWTALAITGIGVTAGAFLLQIWAQTIVGASTAAIVLAAEPAFGVATAWVALGERLTFGGWAGAGLIVAAIYIVITQQRDVSSRAAEAVTPAH
jgi:drug/metabolite transporter (DMT)-like permease